MKCLEIYYLDINKILHLIDKDSLYSFVEKKDFKSEERKIQHALGRFLTKIIALKHNIETPQIYIKNNKPYFENNTLFFSITHTKNIVAVAIWKDNIGIDIEFMKDRDFAKYFERYSITPNGNDKNSFYEFWTKYEAEIKLQEEKEQKLLDQQTKEMKLKLPTEIEFMEEITHLRMNEIIFEMKF